MIQVIGGMPPELKKARLAYEIAQQKYNAAQNAAEEAELECRAAWQAYLTAEQVAGKNKRGE